MAEQPSWSYLVAIICCFPVITYLGPSAASARTTEPPQAKATTASLVDMDTPNFSNMSLDARHREEIKCVILNQLSSTKCSDFVKSQTSEDADIAAGCAKLETFQALVTAVGCVAEDYNKLHTVTCTWDEVNRCVDYYTMQNNTISNYEKQLSPTCNKALSNGIRSIDNPSDYCSKLTSAKANLISNQFCSASELAGVEKYVCCDRQICFLNIDTSTREGRVQLAIIKLSSRCSSSMVVAQKQLSQAPELACPALEATRPALLMDKVCTEKDYADLEKVVCYVEVNCSQDSTAAGCTTTTPDPFASEQEQRDRIQKVIAGELTEACQNFMTEQAAAQINDPLEKTCKNFLDNRGFIVTGGYCSEDEYTKLRVAICGSCKFSPANIVLLSLLSLILSLYRLS